MNSLVSSLLFVLMLITLVSSGTDMLKSGRDVTDAALQRMELEEIGRLLMFHHQQTSRLPRRAEFGDFLRQRLGRLGRDSQLDRWGTPYWLETERYQRERLNYPVDRGEFVLLSAGPDRVWFSQDDLVLANLAIPRPPPAEDAVQAATAQGAPGTCWPSR